MILKLSMLNASLFVYLMFVFSIGFVSTISNDIRKVDTLVDTAQRGFDSIVRTLRNLQKADQDIRDELLRFFSGDLEKLKETVKELAAIHKGDGNSNNGRSSKSQLMPTSSTNTISQASKYKLHSSTERPTQLKPSVTNTNKKISTTLHESVISSGNIIASTSFFEIFSSPVSTKKGPKTQTAISTSTLSSSETQTTSTPTEIFISSDNNGGITRQSRAFTIHSTTIQIARTSVPTSRMTNSELHERSETQTTSTPTEIFISSDNNGGITGQSKAFPIHSTTNQNARASVPTSRTTNSELHERSTSSEIIDSSAIIHDSTKRLTKSFSTHLTTNIIHKSITISPSKINSKTHKSSTLPVIIASPGENDFTKGPSTTFSTALISDKNKSKKTTTFISEITYHSEYSTSKPRNWSTSSVIKKSIGPSTVSLIDTKTSMYQTTTAGEYEECDPGWIKYNRRCFRFVSCTVDVPCSSDRNRFECEKLNGHLASVLSQNDNDFFVTMAPKSTLFLSVGGNDKYWENIWMWENGRLIQSYTNWIPGHPERRNNKKNCLEIHTLINGKNWYNEACTADNTSRGSYVCEKPLYTRK